MVAEIHQHWIGRDPVIAITPAASMSVDRTEWQPSCTLLLPCLLLLEGQAKFLLLGGVPQELPWAQLSRGADAEPWVEIVRASALLGRLATVTQPARAPASTHHGEDAT